jgi:hypothetical protein
MSRLAMLDDIIALAVDSKHPVSELLRRCLVLAHALKNERLKEWANQELNGYKSIEGLPEYRIVQTGAQGSFAGPAGAFIRKRNIPSAVLEEKHRIWAETVYLTQAVSAYDGILLPPANKNTSIIIPWDNNLILRYQSELIDGFALVSAWQEVPRSAVVELLDTIRNRTLNMALELKSEVGDDADVGAAQAQRVDTIIVNSIYGGNVYLASGQSQLHATTVQNVITIGDRGQLDRVLRAAGLADSDLNGFSEAAAADGQTKMGSRVLQ